MTTQDRVEAPAHEPCLDDPPLECDIVMAGGVTSGIIYPGAVSTIAERYRFRCIGGTSVGAIAAAITAAAEYGRRTEQNPKAFDAVSKVPLSLAEQAADGHSRLFHLFTPEATTKPLMDLVAPLFSGGDPVLRMAKVLRATLASPRIGVPLIVLTLAGLVPCTVLFKDGHFLGALIALLAAIALCVATWICATAVAVWHVWLPAWTHNKYGLCLGATSPDRDSVGRDFLGLTPWMHDLVQKIAGKSPDAPLTFGDLWHADAPRETPDPLAPRAIELSMIVSDISRNRSAQLPFIESMSPLYIECSVLKDYFPPEIVTWMIKKRRPCDPHVTHPDKFIRLPEPGDLPVVFGARLSLSFPGLLSAVPLMTPDFADTSKKPLVPLRRVWFSDGGLTSNFPIHFFDSPIPTRPTFCLNLVDFNEAAPSEKDGEGDADKPIALTNDKSRTAESRPKNIAPHRPEPGEEVWKYISMTRGNAYLPSPFTAFDGPSGKGVVAFANAVVSTARCWSDKQTAVAPGVRDRLVNIALREDEGGLNLDMDQNVIVDLDLRGRAAGLLISARFDPKRKNDPETGKTNVQIFPNHRWVRYRNFMAGFEDLTRRFATSRRASDDAASSRNESQLDTMIAGDAPEKLGYPIPAAARIFYKTFTDKLEAMALDLAAATRANPVEAFDRPPAQTHKPALEAADLRSSASQTPRPCMRLKLSPLADKDPRAEAADLPMPREPHID